MHFHQLSTTFSLNHMPFQSSQSWVIVLGIQIVCVLKECNTLGGKFLTCATSWLIKQQTTTRCILRNHVSEFVITEEHTGDHGLGSGAVLSGGEFCTAPVFCSKTSWKEYIHHSQPDEKFCQNFRNTSCRLHQIPSYIPFSAVFLKGQKISCAQN